MKSILALSAAVLTLSTNALAQNELKWAHEDANNDNVSNYSVVNNNFESGNQWANVPMTTDKYEGQKALYLNYLNRDTNENGTYIQAFGFAMIGTSYAGVGLEPNSQDEYLAGKDLTSYNNLEFYIKGTAGANVSALHAWLRSPNGHGSVMVPLKNYVTVDGQWKKVTIPVSAFQLAQPNPNAFQLNNVHAVGFYVNQSNANVPFNIKVDSIRFLKTGGTNPAPLTRLWWQEDPNKNAEYNYSTTLSTNGASVNTANQWGDALIKDFMTGPYGNSPIPAVDLHFRSNAYGYAEAALTTSRQLNGHEPLDFADRDAGKAINPASKLRFASPGTQSGVYVKLVDTVGRSSKSVNINQYRSAYGRYTFDFNIPVSAFLGTGFDINAVKSVNFYVDGTTPAGEYPVKLTYLKFDR